VGRSFDAGGLAGGVATGGGAANDGADEDATDCCSGARGDIEGARGDIEVDADAAGGATTDGADGRWAGACATGTEGLGATGAGAAGLTRGASTAKRRVSASPSRPSATGWRPSTETVTAPASPARTLTSRVALTCCVSPGLKIRSAVTRPSTVKRIHALRRVASWIESGERGLGSADRDPAFDLSPAVRESTAALAVAARLLVSRNGDFEAVPDSADVNAVFIFACGR
jgi:hypothetical protein